MAGGYRSRFPELAVAPAENLHLTLAFLGELDEDGVASARAATSAAAALAGRGGAQRGARRERSRAGSVERVVWLGVGFGEDRLVAAHDLLGAELAARGLPLEGRRYRPHLTVARVRRGLPVERAEELRGWLATAPELPALEVDSLVLYQSILRRPASRHVEIASALL